jgi:hypothetical protein
MGEKKVYAIQDIFANFDEYQDFFQKALARLKDTERLREPSLQRIVPEVLEVHFSNSIKAPRLRFPRWENSIVVELPGSGLAPKAKGDMREKALRKYVSLVKVNEMACADEIAIRMKLFEPEKNDLA